MQVEAFRKCVDEVLQEKRRLDRAKNPETMPPRTCIRGEVSDVHLPGRVKENHWIGRAMIDAAWIDTHPFQNCRPWVFDSEVEHEIARQY